MTRVKLNWIRIVLIQLLVIALVSACGDEEGLRVSSERITFTKADGVDWTQETNQDHITENVWITRANTRGIFNIREEMEYELGDILGSSPAGTEWAFGTTEMNVSNINFVTWAQLHGGYPNDLIGLDLVVHLIEDDIYIDLKFLTWSIGQNGGRGGFSYERSRVSN